jgi:hypothetical protein
MICAMIHHMEQHLPHDEVAVYIWFFYGRIEQHIVPQCRKIVAHTLLKIVPVRADDVPIVNVRERKRF